MDRRQLLSTCIHTIGGLVFLGRHGLAGAAGPKAPPKKLTALIVAVDHYKGLPALKFPVQSSLELARELHRLKYALTFLTDLDSVDRAREALGDGAVVEKVTDGPALKETIFRWLNGEAAPASAQLALLVLNGHGVQRDKQTWFLATDDEPAGGVSVKEINDRAANQLSPLCIIVDACRVEPDAPAPEGDAPFPPRNPHAVSGDRIDQAQGTSVGVSYGVRGPAGKEGSLHARTTLFSTIPGKRAADIQSDLTASLARGLRTDAQKRFTAHTALVGNTDNVSTLSLQAWFCFGVTEVLRSTRLQQSHELISGEPDISTTVAQLDQSGASVVPSPDGNGPVDLVNLWQPQHGDYTSTPLYRGFGWQIANADGKAKEIWSGGFVAPLAGGFDTTDKALFLEFVIECPGDKKPALVWFGLDGKYVDGSTYPDGTPRDVWVLAPPPGRKFLCAAPPNRVMLRKVPLLPGRQLNYIGFSDLKMAARQPTAADPPLPEAVGVLKVRRLFLDDVRLTEKEAANRNAELLARWWIGDGGPQADDTLPFDRVQVKGRPALMIGKGAGNGFRGGALAPPIWVAKGDQLEVELENRGQRGEVVLQLKEEFRSLLKEGKGRISLKPGENKVSLPIDADGVADYLVLAKPPADLYVHSVKVKPGPR